MVRLRSPGASTSSTTSISRVIETASPAAGTCPLGHVRRLARGEKVWQAHRSHWYQRAALAVGHAAVCRRLAMLNAVLIALAISTLQYGDWLPLLGAAAAVLGFLLYLLRLTRAEADSIQGRDRALSRSQRLRHP